MIIKMTSDESRTARDIYRRIAWIEERICNLKPETAVEQADLTIRLRDSVKARVRFEMAMRLKYDIGVNDYVTFNLVEGVINVSNEA